LPFQWFLNTANFVKSPLLLLSQWTSGVSFLKLFFPPKLGTHHLASLSWSLLLIRFDSSRDRLFSSLFELEQSLSSPSPAILHQIIDLRKPNPSQFLGIHRPPPVTYLTPSNASNPGRLQSPVFFPSSPFVFFKVTSPHQRILSLPETLVSPPLVQRSGHASAYTFVKI